MATNDPFEGLMAVGIEMPGDALLGFIGVTVIGKTADRASDSLHATMALVQRIGELDQEARDELLGRMDYSFEALRGWVLRWYDMNIYYLDKVVPALNPDRAGEYGATYDQILETNSDRLRVLDGLIHSRERFALKTADVS